MRIGSLVLGTMMALGIAACDLSVSPFGPGSSGGECGPFGPRACPKRALYIYPDSAHVLKGDTIILRASSETGYVQTTWSSSGGTLRILDTIKTDPRLASSNPVFAVGVKPGYAAITATSVTGSPVAHARLQVHDSSDVDSVHVHLWNPGAISLAAGDSTGVTALIWVADRQAIGARPTTWISSDTSIVVIATRYVERPAIQVNTIRARSPGTAYVVAAFLSRRDSIRMTVTR